MTQLSALAMQRGTIQREDHARALWGDPINFIVTLRWHHSKQWEVCLRWHYCAKAGGDTLALRRFKRVSAARIAFRDFSRACDPEMGEPARVFLLHIYNQDDNDAAVWQRPYDLVYPKDPQ